MRSEADESREGSTDLIMSTKNSLDRFSLFAYQGIRSRGENFLVRFGATVVKIATSFII